MRNRIIILSLVIVVLIQFGCAKRIPISYDQLEKNVFVQIKTKTNTSYQGIVKAKQPSFVVLQTKRNSNSFNKIEKDNISMMFSKPLVYDYQHKVISEWEIKEHQGNKNTILYSIGGSGLSFGMSFFIGSLLHRGLSKSEYRNTALWTTTAVGTAVGTFLFVRTGRKKDREASIMEIRDRRYAIAKKEMMLQQKKREKVHSELEKLKRERARQDAEMERLRKRLQEREEKSEQGEFN